MKKMMSTFAVLLLTLSVACAKADRPIKFEQLPATAQEFLKAHFADVKVSFLKIDDELIYKEYEVLLADGTTVEFNGEGEWKDVDCKRNAVPVAIVPTQIHEYVNAHYPSATITKIDRDRRGYEVSLSNRLELTFDTQFRLVDIDD